ncbi:uncharacterized protein LOC127286796 isoform X2 [Leptopilina boulardi]|uniref:uncharacterized protein LOC127286796 isoform X2 n=1 Tax=Leptopilina boulardi TaxID=63433 RepID=UPI0021F60584|nr:uncharacterized protein LOC127286796 isoform X2 [Leptopilina boulardi]
MGFFKFLVLFLFCTFVAVNCHPPVPRRGSKLRIDQYRLDSSSNIPLIIIRCIQEVENRGMNNINLYHGILMKENEKNLFRELKLSNNVDLSQYSPLTFPKIIKHFLKDLQPHLIAHYVTKKLSQAVESTVDFKKLKALINELPLVNRKTLALLMIHLKRLVLKNKNSALQSELNFYYRGSIFSQHIPADNQRKIIDAFFSLPFEYWNSITNYTSIITIRQGENSAINAEDDEVNHVLSLVEVDTMQESSDEMQSKKSIDQYRLDSSSNIPLIIIRCVQEVENRGMNNINLYHGILMNENEKNLFRELKLSNNVDLSQYSPLTFPKIIKHFLKDLQPHLIAHYVTKKLSQAVESTVDFKKLKALVNKLPLVNRKTLALLMIHLKRLVLKNENSVLQSKINFYYRGAIFSQHIPADNQRKIIDAFFSLPFAYWISITNYTSIITIRQGENSAINTEDDMRNEVNNVLSSEDVSMQQNSDEMQPEMRFISNYALDSSFSIPLIVKRCIQEVENRGMNEPLLYFEISYEENGKKLFTELTNNHVDLSQQNPLIIAETLKFFLRFLKSPLIVPELINEFSQAVESTVDFEKLKELINKLPLVNRRTLALLMTHLKRVLKQNHVSQMQLNIIF